MLSHCHHGRLCKRERGTARAYLGKRRRHYKSDDYRTPYDKPTSLPKWKSFLKPGLTAQALDRLATKLSDTEAALIMLRAWA